MSAEDRGQWPFPGSRAAHAERMLEHLGKTRELAPAVVSAAVETKRQHGELVQALRASTALLTSVGIVLTDGVGRDKAIAQASHNNALLQRMSKGS